VRLAGAAVRAPVPPRRAGGVARDTADWVSMAILAHLVIGMVSVGLNAVALVNDKYR
jgi:hypothetical protein